MPSTVSRSKSQHLTLIEAVHGDEPASNPDGQVLSSPIKGDGGDYETGRAWITVKGHSHLDVLVCLPLKIAEERVTHLQMRSGWGSQGRSRWNDSG